MDLDRRNVRHFVTVAGHLNFGRAAQALHKRAARAAAPDPHAGRRLAKKRGLSGRERARTTNATPA
jgi:hypothetical protein